MPRPVSCSCSPLSATNLIREGVSFVRDLDVDSLQTKWSRLSELDGDQAEDAWKWFVRRYRTFVEAWLRTRRHPDPVAGADEFWSYFFARDAIRKADRDRRFRPYLTGWIRNFARESTRRPRDTPTELGQISSSDESDPALEREEQRLWAHAILHRSLDAVENAKTKRGAALRLFYGIGSNPGENAEKCSVPEVAEALGMAVTSISPLLTEARKLLKQTIERDIRETVSRSDDLRDEIEQMIDSMHEDYAGVVAWGNSQ